MSLIAQLSSLRAVGIAASPHGASSRSRLLLAAAVACLRDVGLETQVVDLAHADRDRVALSADLSAGRRARPPRTPCRMTQVNGTNEPMTQIHDA